jgi:hypothetical protein
MNAMSSRWNILDPDAWADRESEWLEAVTGTMVLIRLNYLDGAGELAEVEMLAGQVIEADLDDGITLRLQGYRDGELHYLPPVPAAFNPIRPDTYPLSGGFWVRNPDLIAAFDITMPLN